MLSSSSSASEQQHQLEALRRYVKSETGAQNQSESTVRLFVTHSNLKNTSFLEIRFDLHSTVEQVKEKLISHCGTSASSMRLQLMMNDGKNGGRESVSCVLSDDSKKLGYYSPTDGMRLHVLDLDPTSFSANGWLEDVSKVEKYVMSDENYVKREGTFRQWAKQKREDDPTWTIQKEMAKMMNHSKIPLQQQHYEKIECAKHVIVGSRCEVNPGGKRGELCFLGKADIEGGDGEDEIDDENDDDNKQRNYYVVEMPSSLPKGYWVGIKFDEPVGKNDGKTPCGVVLIPNCPPLHGSFIRPDKVTCGDFPEIDDFGEDEL